jgi:hypothetical protein
VKVRIGPRDDAYPIYADGMYVGRISKFPSNEVYVYVHDPALKVGNAERVVARFKYVKPRLKANAFARELFAKHPVERIVARVLAGITGYELLKPEVER